ncbi:hypothetical protein M2138_000474 [Dysgonomonadaceae bacterium PH5-43]|nr:hypothetical protein [Dysgonomonadaceae bacterium PH5-43]
MKTKILIACLFISLFSCSTSLSAQKKAKVKESDREYWVNLMCKIAQPILEPMSKGELKQTMNVELSPTWDKRNVNVTYMEAFGRLMAGVAPWFNLPDDDTKEGKTRKQFREWALASYKNAVDPESPDYLLWKGSNQILVDASYIANSFIRAPKALWEPLDDTTKARYIKEFKSLRKIRASYSNWLLFRGMIEAFFVSIGEEYDAFALDLTIRKMEEWYLADGWYSDGPEFSLDYYNSYVIHPMFVEILDVMKEKKVWSYVNFDVALKRMQRYDRLIERLISPEATYPAIGRSVTYRMGAFQTIALSSWKYGLHPQLEEGQVRNALTSIMKRMFSVEGNFDKDNYLQLGFVGHQPNLADYYTNNGSLYMTSLVFLPLGLSPDHSFWTSPAEQWTSQKAWSGQVFQKDYHESIKR